MKNLVYKTIPFDIKNVDMEERTLWAVGSTEGFDRDGDRIRMDGWDIENYLKNPVILWAHNYREPPIGKALDVVPQANGLWFKILFAKTGKAQEIFGLYADGFMRAWSVGFLPKQKQELKHEEDLARTGWDYIRQELLELSAVPVPANPDALNVLRAKGIFDGMTDELIDNLVSQMEGLVEELPPAHMKPYPNEHACRLKDPANYDTCRRGDRTAHEPESVRGKKYHVIYCKKGDGPMEQQAFRYPVASWTAEQASAHCKYNKGTFAAATGQSGEDNMEIKTPEVPTSFFEDFASDLKKDRTRDVVSIHRRVHQWAEQGIVIEGLTAAQMAKLHNIIAKDLTRRCKEEDGENCEHDSPLSASDFSKGTYGPETKCPAWNRFMGRLSALLGRGIDAESTLDSETDERSAGEPPAPSEVAAETLPDDIVAELLKAIRGIKEVFK